MVIGVRSDTGRGYILFGDKRARRIQILRKLVLRNKGHVQNTCGKCN